MAGLASYGPAAGYGGMGHRASVAGAASGARLPPSASMRRSMIAGAGGAGAGRRSSSMAMGMGMGGGGALDPPAASIAAAIAQAVASQYQQAAAAQAQAQAYAQQAAQQALEGDGLGRRASHARPPSH
eukprot:tig00021348_g20562.t1